MTLLELKYIITSASNCCIDDNVTIVNASVLPSCAVRCSQRERRRAFVGGSTPVCLDGTIIDISTILVTVYYSGYVGV